MEDPQKYKVYRDLIDSIYGLSYDSKPLQVKDNNQDYQSDIFFEILQKDIKVLVDFLDILSKKNTFLTKDYLSKKEILEEISKKSFFDAIINDIKFRISYKLQEILLQNKIYNPEKLVYDFYYKELFYYIGNNKLSYKLKQNKYSFFGNQKLNIAITKLLYFLYSFEELDHLEVTNAFITIDKLKNHINKYLCANNNLSN